MAQRIDTSSGYANAAKGINTLNAVADVDPRKAVIFDSVAEALENVPLSMRAEGLELKVRAADGTIDVFRFVGGIADADFKIIRENLKTTTIFYGDNQSSNLTTVEQISNIINNGKPFVLDGSTLPIFRIVIDEIIYTATVKGILKGSFGLNSPDNISAFNIIIFSEKSLNSQTIKDSNTVYHDLGDILSSEIHIFIRNLNPAINVQPLADGFTVFQAIQDGEAKEWVYYGESGLVGFNEYQPLPEDLKPLNIVSSVLPTLQEVIDNSVLSDIIRAFFPSQTLIEDKLGIFKIQLDDKIISFNSSKDGSLIIDASFLKIAGSNSQKAGKILTVKTDGTVEWQDQQKSDWNESNPESPNFIKNKPPSSKEMKINSGGNYNNIELTGNIINFTNTNAQAILNGFQHNVYKRITLINNGDFDIRLNNEDANSDADKQIKLPTGLASIGVEGTSELIYVDSIQKWQITDAFASKYRPEHRGLAENMVETVTPDAKSETHPIIDYEVFRDAQSTTMSKSDLNTAYPDAIRGMQVVCKQIDLIYKKVDDNTNDWVSIPLTSVV